MIGGLSGWIALLLVGAAPPGDPTPEDPQPRVGTILAHGGGPPGMAYIRDFVRRCGRGSHLVVIPTASFKRPNAPRKKIHDKWTHRGFGEVSVLHTHVRAEAEREAFSEPLERADCVWLSGGAQARLEDAYVGTPVIARLRAVLERGGVISGYSAGASILTSVIIRRGNPDPEEGHGFGLLPGIVIDQHFVALEREARLMVLLDRHPELVGYGIDERTGLVITGSQYEVVGSSVVRECRSGRACRNLPPGSRGTLGTPASD